MVKYYYDKFTAIPKTSYIEPGWVSQGGSFSVRYADLAKSYSWNPSTGKFTLNSDFYASGTMVPTGAVGYRLLGTLLYRYSKTDASSLAEYSSNASASTKDSNSASTNTTYTKGSLVQSNIIAEDGTYPTNGRHIDGYWYVKGSVAPSNNIPTISLTSPSNNQTLYENDIMNISGEAYDSDKDQSVTIYYQINNEPRKVLATNLSQTQISLSKQLVFKASMLFDGDVAVTGVLSDGVAHLLKVWAVDSDGGHSDVVDRTFYVVPNRAPSLIVNNPTPSGIINSDSFTISGSYSDLDGNMTTVVYKINGSNSIQIAQGTEGDFTFDITLGSLQVGVNTLSIEATDSYGAKTSKTIKLNKTEVLSPILHSTARYKVEPPTGKATEILTWIQHDADLLLSASVSMTIAGEPETFVPMTLENTTILQNGQVEDEFYYSTESEKDTIVLKLDLTKSKLDANETVTLITGVF